MSQETINIERPWGNGRIVWTRDATADDSDKTFTVPAGKVWSVLSIEASMICSATVGNRYLGVDITNGAAKVFSSALTGAVAASAVCGIYLAPGSPPSSGTPYKVNLASGVQETVCTRDTIPTPMLLPAGYVVRVWDEAAIDAAADDLTVALHYIEYDA